MQKKSKFFFGLCVLASLLASVSVASLALAADTTTNPAYITSVSNVTLSKSAYNQGDTVNGSFVITNSGTQTASDLYYRVSLAGQYDKNQVPQIIYGQTDLQGPLSVAPNQKSTINFSYKLPAYVGGNGLGIQINLLTKQGQLLGWNNALFTASGSMSAVTIKGFSIGLGGNFFVPSTGPTIHQGELPTVVVDMTNPLKTGLTLNAQIKVYNRITTGDPLYASTSPAFTLAPSAKKSVTYALPVFNNTPGVYAGTISFVDATGTPHSPTLEFRYIVGGDIATIQSVNTGSGVAIKGQIVNVSVLYSGAPFDTRTTEGVGVGTANLSIKLYNEKNELVGNSSSSISIVDVSTKIVGITAQTNAQALRADVVITKNGKTLSALSTSLSPVLKTLPMATTSPATSSAIPNTMTIVLAGLGFLLIVFLFWLIFKKHKQNISFIPPAPAVPPTVSSVSSIPPSPTPVITPVQPLTFTSPEPKVVPPTPPTPLTPPTPVTPAMPTVIPPATIIALILIAGSLLGFAFFKAQATDETIVTVNTVANAPTITGSANVFTDDTNQYDITYSTTTLKIRYAFSLNGDTKIDQYLPSKSGWLDGNTTKSIFLSWPTAGTSYKFGVQAFAVNSNGENGAKTAWQIFPVTVNPNPISVGYGGPGGWTLVSFNGARASGRELLSPSDISLAILPSGGPSFNPGDSINMQFTVQALQCANTAQKIVLNVQSMKGTTDGINYNQSVSSFKPLNPTPVNNGSTLGCTQGHCDFAFTSSLVPSGWFNVPTTPGTYRIYFKIDDLFSSNTHGVVYGYKQIEVVAPVIVGTCNATVPTMDTITSSTACNPPNVNLQWQASSGATAYNVYRATGSQDGTYTGLASGMLGNSQTANPIVFNDGAVSIGQTYYYKVSASNCAGTSTLQTNGTIATLSACTPPSGIISCSNSLNQLYSLNLTSQQIADLGLTDDVVNGGCKCVDPAKNMDTETPPKCVSPADVSDIQCVPEEIDPTDGNLKEITSAKVGDSITWKVKGDKTVQSGYYWMGSGITSQSGGSSIQVNYSTIGQKTMSVKFGAEGSYVPCSTVVNGPPVNYLPVYSGQVFVPN